jgi:hypothetical protein
VVQPSADGILIAAVMTLAFVHLRDRTLTWLGVGNVEAVLFHRARECTTTPNRALLRAGVIGYLLNSR